MKQRELVTMGVEKSTEQESTVSADHEFGVLWWVIICVILHREAEGPDFRNGGSRSTVLGRSASRARVVR